MEHFKVTKKGRVWLLIGAITLTIWSFILTFVTHEFDFGYALKVTAEVTGWILLMPAMIYALYRLAVSYY